MLVFTSADLLRQIDELISPSMYECFMNTILGGHSGRVVTL